MESEVLHRLLVSWSSAQGRNVLFVNKQMMKMTWQEKTSLSTYPNVYPPVPTYMTHSLFLFFGVETSDGIADRVVGSSTWHRIPDDVIPASRVWQTDVDDVTAEQGRMRRMWRQSIMWQTQVTDTRMVYLGPPAKEVSTKDLMQSNEPCYMQQRHT